MYWHHVVTQITLGYSETKCCLASEIVFSANERLVALPLEQVPRENGDPIFFLVSRKGIPIVCCNSVFDEPDIVMSMYLCQEQC